MKTAQRYSWALALTFFLLDRITKHAALVHLVPACSVPVFSFFGITCQLTLTTNTGAAWGMLFQSPVLLFIVRSIFIGVLWYIYLSTKHALGKFSLLLILIGACNNIIDTLLWGHVIDFIHFSFWGWDYPVFNIADICICVGSLLFFICCIKER